MPPYNQIHAEYLLYIFLGGGLLVALIGLAALSRHLTASTRRVSEQELEAEVHTFGEVQEGHRPVPLFLWVLLTLFVLWAIGYTLFSGENFPY